MDLSMPTIEDITAQRLRKLDLGKQRKEPAEEEEDIYFEEIVLELEEQDAISPEESGFMIGYLHSSDY